MENLRLQEVILAQVLLEKDAYHVCKAILVPEDFTHDYRHIYQAVQDVDEAGLSVDLITVVDRLTAMKKLDDVGGAYGVASLTNKVASSGNIESHSLLLKKRSAIHKAKQLGAYLSALEGTEKHTDVIERIQTDVDNMLSGQSANSRLLAEVMEDELEERKGRTGSLAGYPTGMRDWDRVIGGVYAGVHVVAARPAMGKTAFAVTCAIEISKSVPVCIWSGEMTADKIFLRVESNLSGVPTNRLRLNNMYANEIEDVERAHGWVKQCQIEVDDTPNLDIANLRIKVMKWKARYGSFVLVMDYLGLMEDGGDEYRGVTNNSKRIHQIANEFDVPVILLHQLSRSVESREDKYPSLSDLRGSGGIEQDADTVTFLYRPDYYKLKVDPITGMDVEPNLAYAIVKKNREGMVGDVQLKFEGHRSRFVNY